MWSFTVAGSVVGSNRFLKSLNWVSKDTYESVYFASLLFLDNPILVSFFTSLLIFWGAIPVGVSSVLVKSFITPSPIVSLDLLFTKSYADILDGFFNWLLSSKLPSANGWSAPGLGVNEDHASFNSLRFLSKSAGIGILPLNLASTWGFAVPGMYLPFTPKPYTKCVPASAAAWANVAARIVGVWTAAFANSNVSSLTILDISLIPWAKALKIYLYYYLQLL